MMCCFIAVQFLEFDAWFPLQFMHRFVLLVHLFWEQSPPHLTHDCLFLQCLFVCPSLWQFVHCNCVLFMKIVFSVCVGRVVCRCLVDRLILLLCLF